MRSHRARQLAPCALFVALSVPAVSAAQSTAVSAQDAAVRRQLISDAQRAAGAGNHEQAFNLAERASQIEMTPSLRLFLAQEANVLRRFVVAIGHADLCLREVGAMPTLNNRQRIIDGCTAAQTAANAAIGRVLLRVPSPAPAGTTVTINGTPVNPATWGVAMPVDPGTLRVVARANGMETFELELNVASGQEQPVNVVFRPAANSASNTTANGANTANTSTTNTTSASTTTGAGGTSTSVNTANTTSGTGANSTSNAARNSARTSTVVDTNPPLVDAPPPRSNVGPYVLIGVGGVAAIGAAISAAAYAINLDGFRRVCSANEQGQCNMAEMNAVTSYADAAGTFGVTAWVTGAVAVGAIAGGVGWMLSNNAANARDRERATWVLPARFANGAGLIVGGNL
jgi:hypothetical protein